MTGVNIALLDELLTEADRNDFHLEQWQWFSDYREFPWEPLDTSSPLPPCGTSCCVAGGIAWKLGWRPTLDIFGDWGGSSTWTRQTDDGSVEERDVATIGREALGLDLRSAAILFEASHSRETTQRVRDILAEQSRIDWCDLHRDRDEG